MLAAGAICWRTTEAGSGLEVLLVHSTRWGDWSWPKGKLDHGETLPECAVREVAEETGARIELGVPLGSVRYTLPDGQDKTVTYWAGRVLDSGPRTASVDEISAAEWLPIEAAQQRLTRPGDFPPLARLLELAGTGRLDTRPLLVVRHAKARSRAHWLGGEADRPLTSAGRRQARGLAGLLACWQPERMLSSPWARCMQTLGPYFVQLDKADQSDIFASAGTLGDRHRGRAHRADLEVVPALSEHGLRENPSRVGVTIRELLDGDRGALLCTHRPVLAVVVEELAESADWAVRGNLPGADPWLAPAEILVVHISIDRPPNATMYIHSVERHRAEPSRNALR